MSDKDNRRVKIDLGNTISVGDKNRKKKKKPRKKGRKYFENVSSLELVMFVAIFIPLSCLEVEKNGE